MQWKKTAQQFKKQKSQKEQIEQKNVDIEHSIGSTKEFEYDMFTMNAKHHRRLYEISNVNYFFRKAYGLMVALPWELTFEVAIEESLEDNAHKLTTIFLVSLFATIILSYCGIQFLKIQSGLHHHSTSHGTEQLLKGNFRKLKKFI